MNRGFGKTAMDLGEFRFNDMDAHINHQHAGMGFSATLTAVFQTYQSNETIGKWS
jgi:hypothetical protein